MCKKVTVRVDSAQRDKELYPSSTKFVYTLNQFLPNVIGAELRSFTCWDSSYPVNLNNNSLSVNGTTVTIDPGNYSDYELATHLETVLNQAGTGITFNAIRDAITGRLSIVGSAEFTLDFPAGAAKLFGFKQGEYSGESSYVGTNLPLLSTPAFYYLVLKEIPNRHDYPKSCFAVINNSAAHGQLLIMDENNRVFRDGFKVDLSSLTVELMDENYNIVDLNGHDFQFEIEFILSMK